MAIARPGNQRRPGVRVGARYCNSDVTVRSDGRLLGTDNSPSSFNGERGFYTIAAVPRSSPFPIPPPKAMKPMPSPAI